MSLFSKLFGGASGRAKTPEAEPEEYKGFAIHPAPIEESGRWRVAARIEKQVDGEDKVHQLIRADTLDSRDAATEASVNKAKQMIDEQGERLFG
ncbi:hypothetical protein OG2516_04673 [Oceanicola granulosus HTCC2516]|uniref:Transcriptional activator HlyU n=1 Tax=Oceanicola granulosus (strain ATCC BAA-861 / DSM 15982 / KCTC 12143 / HTCC2516) TaxID=314256 RepID=Q2CAS6_OCEGH|nr:HlyU family transcriptional regulator [Oceanicola granulosus]EAR49762.1 hypothetical protein OG2516_04673 [Oceanicola granulosus HTCC2516]